MRNALLIVGLGVVTYAVDDWRIAAAAAIVACLALTRNVAAVAAAGAGAIHFAVAPEHYAEWWGYGTFFVICAETQLAWAFTTRFRRAGAVASLALVGLWAVTRTTGLPFGPDPGQAEAIGASDLVAVGLELLTAVAVFARLSLTPIHKESYA